MPNPIRSAGEHQLHRALGPFHLIMIGIGCIIGAGIFVIAGTAAAQHAGPAVLISFVFAALACLFAGLCYAEFAAMIPVSGSAYTYAYATMGRFVAWFIGWNLVLEYGVSASTVAVGWSGYFVSLLSNFGIDFPASLANAPLAGAGPSDMRWTGALINLPATILTLALTALLVVGMRASAQFNGAMVLIKTAIILLVILFGLPFVQPDNLTPFIPPNEGEFGRFGWSGILAASGMVFFAYIGFDAVSVAAQEAKNPQRDVPMGILGSLVICGRAVYPDGAGDGRHHRLPHAQRAEPGVLRRGRSAGARLARAPDQHRRADRTCLRLFSCRSTASRGFSIAWRATDFSGRCSARCIRHTGRRIAARS